MCRHNVAFDHFAVLIKEQNIVYRHLFIQEVGDDLEIEIRFLDFKGNKQLELIMTGPAEVDDAIDLPTDSAEVTGGEDMMRGHLAPIAAFGAELVFQNEQSPIGWLGVLSGSRLAPQSTIVQLGYKIIFTSADRPRRITSRS